MTSAASKMKELLANEFPTGVTKAFWPFDSKPKPPISDDLTNFFNIMNRFHFIGQDGKRISADDLREKTAGGHIIFLSSFTGCGEKDPNIYIKTHEIEQAVKSPHKVKFVVLNGHGLHDPNELMRQEFWDDLTKNSNPRMRLNPDNIITLYPVAKEPVLLSEKGTKIDGFATPDDATKAVIGFQQKSGGDVSTFRSGYRPGHYQRIVWYSEDGQPRKAQQADNINSAVWANEIMGGNSAASRAR